MDSKISEPSYRSDLRKSNSTLGYHGLDDGYGYLLDKLTPEAIQELDVELKEFNPTSKKNNYLAGEIEHEYNFPTQPLTRVCIEKAIEKLDNQTGIIAREFPETRKLKHDKWWINFQKKHEYNPYHYHRGIYSWVIWHKVPYTFENESKYHNYKDPEYNMAHGAFCFCYSAIGTRWLRQLFLNVDNEMEGYIAVFPSTLYHAVYPFYSSDKYRITIAGNVVNEHFSPEEQP